MDPTRPVTVACDNIAAEPKATLPAFLEKLDVVGYNYVDRWRDRREKFYSIDRHDYPKRKFIGTESPGLGGVRGAYRLGDEPPIFGERSSNNRIEAEQLQKFVQTYDYVSGDFMWTGHRLSGRVVLARQTRRQRRTGHLRLSERRLLFLSEHMDGKAGAASLPALELAGPRGRDHRRWLLHQLRHG